MHDRVIHMLSIKGFAKAEILAEACDTAPDTIEGTLDALAKEALLETTRMGIKLTDQGKARAEQLLQEQREQGNSASLEEFYANFESVNAEYKQALADWQMRAGPDGPVPNDHSDDAYDGQVKERMFVKHQSLVDALHDLAPSWPLLAFYGVRLAKAFEKVESGQQRYLAAPLIDSYHTVWFELHEALIRASGRNRAEEAAAGRAV
ncbi:MAG: hypothetical protein AAF098_07730 [Pseudomonadota bacterium]